MVKYEYGTNRENESGTNTKAKLGTNQARVSKVGNLCTKRKERILAMAGGAPAVAVGGGWPGFRVGGGGGAGVGGWLQRRL